MADGELHAEMVVGIFLCKDVNQECVRLLLLGILDRPGVARVLIRPHPKNLWRGLDKWIASLNSSRVVLTGSSSVLDDIRKADIVLGGNSSVLVDAVTCGRPAGFVANLDHGPRDLHQFVARGLIYCVTDDSGNLKWEPEAMMSFYQRPQWLETLKLFANI